MIIHDKHANLTEEGLTTYPSLFFSLLLMEFDSFIYRIGYLLQSLWQRFRLPRLSCRSFISRNNHYRKEDCS